MNNLKTTPASFPSSYPLGALVETPPEWMIDLLADLYAAEIVGTHGFGIRHPRAAWLNLVVSSVTECFCCEAPARWEEDYQTAYCSRCAEAEIAVAAARGAVPRHAPAYETEPTKVEPFLPDAQLPPLRTASLLCALVVAVLSMTSGCATARPPAAPPETVGTLAPSYASIAVAPLKHDAPPDLGGVAGTDDDAPATTSLDVLHQEAAQAGAVDVAPKTDGVTVGGGR